MVLMVVDGERWVLMVVDNHIFSRGWDEGLHHDSGSVCDEG